VLKQYGFHATAFIISSRIKRHPQKWDPKSLQFMSISELRQIQDVFDIQSHTHFLHRVDAGRRPILFSRNYHNILFDFARSRRALASLIRTFSTFPIPSAAITPRRCRRRMTRVSYGGDDGAREGEAGG
jgi:peptidoglycan/xylan/chitin deacetylase (PgdA/CDA1 family)